MVMWQLIILILVDSSASMGRWIGGDGLGAAWGVTTDLQDRILIGQNARRTIGAVVRYTTAGARDGSFRPIRTVPGAGCSVHLDATRANLSGRMRKAANVRFVENLEINGVQENVILWQLEIDYGVMFLVSQRMVEDVYLPPLLQIDT